MPENLARVVTRENVIQALEQVINSKEELISSTKFDIVYKGKRFPPKEIVRKAAQIQNIEDWWTYRLSGGESTNKPLREKGFEIRLKENAMRFFIGGSKWGEDDYTKEFIDDGYWENGYNDRFIEEIKDVPEGSLFAIKSSYAKPGDSILRIKCIGEVVENKGDGKVLTIRWQSPFTPYDISGLGKYRETFHEITNEADIDLIFNHEEEPQGIEGEVEDFATKKPLNTILYGPPGTGKTFHSIDWAVHLIDGTSFENHSDNKKRFDDLRKQGQIEFVTFHQNYGYEDFMVGISPDVLSGNLRFERKEGVFKQINDKAKSNWIASLNSGVPDVSFNQVFNSFFSKLIEEEVTEVEIPMKSKGYSFKITKIDFDEGRLKFTKHSGGTGHDLLLSNIKGIYEETLDYASEGLGVYYYPLNEKLKEHAASIATTSSRREPLKNYVLVIDEINRANISKVFGELITLLEDDKRLGEANELRITLPNGEKEFGIPPNMYLIGTMNTADKSIALIDIALRRRFEFIGKYPTYEKLSLEDGRLLQKINEAIYEEKKSADYLIGHAYFMKNLPIELVIKNKVVPLLMEYFSGRVETVSRIFKHTDWKVSYDKTTFNWDINLNDK